VCVCSVCVCLCVSVSVYYGVVVVGSSWGQWL